MSSTDGRVLGQQVSITLAFPNKPIRDLGPIADASFNFDAQLIQRGYLGERADRFDEVFKGVKGKLSANIDSDSWFDFVTQVIERQQRLAVFVINLQGIFRFSNGRTRRLLIPDISIGAIPLDVGSREEYVKTAYDFGASSAKAGARSG